MAVVVGGCRRARCSPLDRPLNVCMHVQLRMVEASNENERQIEASERAFASLIVHVVVHRSCLIESFRERGRRERVCPRRGRFNRLSCDRPAISTAQMLK